ncbi:MAG: hypothetical protein QM489_01695 [Candidatus Izemoplasma sp.]
MNQVILNELDKFEKGIYDNSDVSGEFNELVNNLAGEEVFEEKYYTYYQERVIFWRDFYAK